MDGKRTIVIHRGPERVLELGGLRFAARRREIEAVDGGTTLEVWGDVDGTDTQVLRFDCFRQSPHYHVPPDAPGEIAIEARGEAAIAAWVVERVTRDASALLAEAGFAGLAGAIDTGKLAGGRAELSRLLTNLPEPDEASEFQVDPAQLPG